MASTRWAPRCGPSKSQLTRPDPPRRLPRRIQEMEEHYYRTRACPSMIGEPYQEEITCCMKDQEHSPPTHYFNLFCLPHGHPLNNTATGNPTTWSRELGHMETSYTPVGVGTPGKRLKYLRKRMLKLLLGDWKRIGPRQVPPSMGSPPCGVAHALGHTRHQG